MRLRLTHHNANEKYKTIAADLDRYCGAPKSQKEYKVGSHDICKLVADQEVVLTSPFSYGSQIQNSLLYEVPKEPGRNVVQQYMSTVVWGEATRHEHYL